MKNREKYAEQIKKHNGHNFCDNFICPIILKRNDCFGVNCIKCHMLQILWLEEEYEEPEVNWSKVDVDTPVFVKNLEDGVWHKRYFKKFEGGKVCTWRDGKTSWSAASSNNTISWKYAKLAEGDEGNE